MRGSKSQTDFSGEEFSTGGSGRYCGNPYNFNLLLKPL